MDNKLSELSKPVAWPNGCNETSVKALRYLAEHKRPIGGSDMYNTEHLYMIARELEIMSSQHFYSQEYVSALLAELEKSQKHEKEWRSLCEAAAVDLDDWRATDDKSRGLICKLADVIIERNERIAELEAKDKRIAELEYDLKCVIADNEDCERTLARKDAAIDTFITEYDDAQKIIAELEAKLATPVRLPNKNDAEFWFDGVFQVARFDRAVERAVSTAGFKFVGE